MNVWSSTRAMGYGASASYADLGIQCLCSLWSSASGPASESNGNCLMLGKQAKAVIKDSPNGTITDPSPLAPPHYSSRCVPASGGGMLSGSSSAPHDFWGFGDLLPEPLCLRLVADLTTGISIDSERPNTGRVVSMEMSAVVSGSPSSSTHAQLHVYTRARVSACTHHQWPVVPVLGACKCVRV